jgi:hypothetical protein
LRTGRRAAPEGFLKCTRSASAKAAAQAKTEARFNLDFVISTRLSVCLYAKGTNIPGNRVAAPSPEPSFKPLDARGRYCTFCLPVPSVRIL